MQVLFDFIREIDWGSTHQVVVVIVLIVVAYILGRNKTRQEVSRIEEKSRPNNVNKSTTLTCFFLYRRK